MRQYSPQVEAALLEARRQSAALNAARQAEREEWLAKASPEETLDYHVHRALEADNEYQSIQRQLDWLRKRFVGYRWKDQELVGRMREEERALYSKAREVSARIEKEFKSGGQK